MAINKEKVGVYQLENGYWGYRFTNTINGKRHNHKGTRDENGNRLKTQKEAIRAREAAKRKITPPEQTKKILPRKTVREVYEEYCQKGRSGKAYTTIRKQDSLWYNHIFPKFGRRMVDEISTAEVVDYLSELYYTEGRAYRYVESFLKMFYLIFGQAYSRDYLDTDTYNKLCVNKNTKIHMPKQKVNEDLEIVIFTPNEMERLDQYFHNTNGETAYLLGKYCGLRINECYGLKWQNVDLETGCLVIDRQMQYQEGLIKLVPLKTRNARRTIYMAPQLKEYFQHLKEQQEAAAIDFAPLREQNQTMLTDMDGRQISCLELVNCLPNGKIQTVNSMKYHAQEIKRTLGIYFKYHYLRHKTCRTQYPYPYSLQPDGTHQY